MSAVALPHLPAADDAVELVRFVVRCQGQELVAPEFVPDWDAEVPLSLDAEIELDLDAVLASAGLAPGSVVGGLLRWHAQFGSGLRGASTPVPLRDGATTLTIDLDGSLLGGILQVDVLVVLMEAAEHGHPLCARRFGSLLWESRRKVRLEGAGSRFPVSQVSFGETGLAGGLTGAWALHFESQDLHDSGIGNLRLYLNTDHPAVQDYLDAPDDVSWMSAVLRQDVLRQMVLQAIHHEELDLDAAYPSDSMGELLAMTVRRNFPYSTLDEVRAMSRNSPGEFEASLQGRSGFLR
jgi:hypothetical protein